MYNAVCCDFAMDLLQVNTFRPSEKRPLHVLRDINIDFAPGSLTLVRTPLPTPSSHAVLLWLCLRA